MAIDRNKTIRAKVKTNPRKSDRSLRAGVAMANKMEIVVSEEHLHRLSVNIGKIGDGKILVYEVEQAMLVRIGETGGRPPFGTARTDICL